jgi:hypothetical protein
MAGLKSRMKERYQFVRERDRKWLMQFTIEGFQRKLIPLLGAFVVLNFIDVVSTLIAKQSTTGFQELNPVASALFGLQFGGFVVALLLKYSPTFILTYIASIGGAGTRHPVGTRAAKLSALVVLVAGNIFYVYVVGSNLGNLLRLYL